MKIIAPLLSALLFLLPLHAADEPRETLHPSPDASFQAAVLIAPEQTTGRLEIRTAAGEVIFRGPPDASGNGDAFDPEHLLWSPDSRLLAIGDGSSHFELTRLFLKDGNSFTEIPCPELEGQHDNPQIVPLRWHRGHLLTLRANGPHAGHADNGSYTGTIQVRVDTKAKTATHLSEKIIETPPGGDDPANATTISPHLEVSEIALPTGNPAFPSSGLLFSILPAPDPATGLAAGQFIVPCECIVPISAAGSPVRYLSSTDEQTLIYGLQRSKPGSIEIDAYSLVPRLGPRHYDSLDRIAGEKIARSKLGRRLFPQGVELLNSRVADLTARTVTLTATASPASIGGQKSLSCTLQFQPDTDATVKLLHWHLSEK